MTGEISLVKDMIEDFTSAAVDVGKCTGSLLLPNLKFHYCTQNCNKKLNDYY